MTNSRTYDYKRLGIKVVAATAISTAVFAGTHNAYADTLHKTDIKPSKVLSNDYKTNMSNVSVKVINQLTGKEVGSGGGITEVGTTFTNKWIPNGLSNNYTINKIVVNGANVGSSIGGKSVVGNNSIIIYVTQKPYIYSGSLSTVSTTGSPVAGVHYKVVLKNGTSRLLTSMSTGVLKLPDSPIERIDVISVPKDYQVVGQPDISVNLEKGTRDFVTTAKLVLQKKVDPIITKSTTIYCNTIGAKLNLVNNENKVIGTITTNGKPIIIKGDVSKIDILNNYGISNESITTSSNGDETIMLKLNETSLPVKKTEQGKKDTTIKTKDTNKVAKNKTENTTSKSVKPTDVNKTPKGNTEKTTSKSVKQNNTYVKVVVKCGNKVLSNETFSDVKIGSKLSDAYLPSLLNGKYKIISVISDGLVVGNKMVGTVGATPDNLVVEVVPANSSSSIKTAGKPVDGKTPLKQKPIDEDGGTSNYNISSNNSRNSLDNSVRGSNNYNNRNNDNNNSSISSNSSSVQTGSNPKTGDSSDVAEVFGFLSALGALVLLNKDKLPNL